MLKSLTCWKSKECVLNGGYISIKCGQGGAEVRTWLIHKNPQVECGWESWCVAQVFITSHFPLPSDTTHTHTHHTPHFHFSLGWAVRLEYQTPSFPKWDLLRFTSSIKTSQWSQDSILSRYKTEQALERLPKNSISSGSSKGCRGNENCVLFLGLFKGCFFTQNCLISFCTPLGWDAISDTLSCNPTQLPPQPHTHSNTHSQESSLACHHVRQSVNTHPDWQINVWDECKQTRPAPPWLHFFIDL